MQLTTVSKKAMHDERIHDGGRSRRSALKVLGTGLAGAVGVGTATRPAAAQQTEWQNSDEVFDTHNEVYHSLGVGLKLKNDFVDEAGDYNTIWEIAGDGVVNNDNKEFPAPDDYYDEVPDTIDMYPRQGPENYPGSVRHQGFTIDKGSNPLGIEADFNDNDEVHMFPRDGDTGDDEFDDIALTAAEIAVGAITGYGGVIAAAELAAEIYEFAFGTSGPTFDLTNYYSGHGNAFFRGGFGVDELRIIADGGDSGTVDITADFGQASTGFEIYQQYDGFGGPVLDVTKK